MQRIKQATRFLQRQNTMVFILLFALVCVVYMYLFNCTVFLFNIPDVHMFGDPPSLEEWGLFKMFVMTVILAPLLETALCQMLPYYLILGGREHTRRLKYIAMTTSVLLFGVQHIYSLLYVIYTIPIGALLMYAYLISVGKNPFWRITAIHALFNFIMVIFDKMGLMPLNS